MQVNVNRPFAANYFRCTYLRTAPLARRSVLTFATLGYIRERLIQTFLQR